MIKVLICLGNMSVCLTENVLYTQQITFLSSIFLKIHKSVYRKSFNKTNLNKHNFEQLKIEYEPNIKLIGKTKFSFFHLTFK